MRIYSLFSNKDVLYEQKLYIFYKNTSNSSPNRPNFICQFFNSYTKVQNIKIKALPNFKQFQKPNDFRTLQYNTGTIFFYQYSD